MCQLTTAHFKNTCNKIVLLHELHLPLYKNVISPELYIDSLLKIQFADNTCGKKILEMQQCGLIHRILVEMSLCQLCNVDKI